MDNVGARWYLLKFQADVWRGEPLNVGVIVTDATGQSSMRFLFEDENGGIDGRAVKPLKADADNYRRWVAYFRRTTQNADKLRRALDRWTDARQASYFLTDGGATNPDQYANIDELADTLFGALVASDAMTVQRSDADPIESRVDRIFRSLDIHPERNVSRIVHASDVAGPVEFGYSYQNGQIHLIDTVRLDVPGQRSRQAATDFIQRMQWARDADWAKSYLAFYLPPKEPTEQLTFLLDVIAKGAVTADLDNEAESVEVASQVLKPH